MDLDLSDVFVLVGALCLAAAVGLAVGWVGVFGYAGAVGVVVGLAMAWRRGSEKTPPR